MERPQIRWYIRWGIDTIRYEGLHILLWRILRLVLTPLGDLRVISYCRKDLTQPLRNTQAKVDLFIGQATEYDIDQLAELVMQRWSPSQQQRMFKTKSIEEMIIENFQQGAKCFVGKIGTDMVHYNWIFFHGREYEHYFIHLGDFEALCDDAFTVEEWRGKAIHGAVHNQMLSFLQQSGYHTAYTIVLADNISSGKALRREGWNFYGTILIFCSDRFNKVLTWELKGPLDPFILKST
jgi:RimJ/RimL family protein N-acetyltransferase